MFVAMQSDALTTGDEWVLCEANTLMIDHLAGDDTLSNTVARLTPCRMAL